MSRIGAAAGAVFLLLTLVSAGFAQTLRLSEPGDTPVLVDADRVDFRRSQSVVKAQGEVVIRQGSLELNADEIEYSHTQRWARASGRVRLRGPDGSLVADRVFLNLEDETGEVENLEMHADDSGYSLWGDRASKSCGQNYRIENGRFTTCQCAEGAPSWSLTGHRLDVSLGGYADLRGGRFNILDYPVLYVPRVLFPVRLERQSGFLMPRFGASSRRGFQAMLPFFWAIDKSEDATVAFDVETSARLGGLAEYRYSLTRSSSGVVGASYFNESIRGETDGPRPGTTIPRNRWSVTTEQDQELPASVFGYSDVFLVGDDLFLREINTYSIEQPRVVAIRTLPFTRSRVGLIRTWDRAAANVEATYYENLAQPASVAESQTLQRAPEVHGWGQISFQDMLLASWDATAVSFVRGRDADGFRLDLQPRVEVPLPIGPYAFGSVRATARETAYRLYDTTTGDDLDFRRSQSREIFRADADLWTSVGRVFHVPWFGGYKLKHLVEPALGYTFVPGVAQDDIPLLDGVDRVNARNQFTYGVSTRILAKADDEADSGAEAPHEIGRLSLAQTIDIDRRISPISCEIGGVDPCAADHFSDLDIGGRINPNRFLSLRFRGNYDTNNSNLSAAQVSFYVEDPRSAGQAANGEESRISTKTSASVGYRFLAPNRLQQVDGNLVLELNEWAGFLYSSRYDVVSNRFLDNFYGLRFLSRCDCWSLDLTVTDRINPSELEVRAQISLVGLGSSESRRRAAFLP